jgi:hypothetical protein
MASHPTTPLAQTAHAERANPAIASGPAQLLDLAAATVANQESQVPEKQQRAGCRPRSAIRLAHLPGEAAVPPGGARLLSAVALRSCGARMAEFSFVAKQSLSSAPANEETIPNYGRQQNRSPTGCLLLSSEMEAIRPPKSSSIVRPWTVRSAA